IVVRAEAAPRRERRERREDRHRTSHAQAICRAAAHLAEDLNVVAIAAFTRTGRTGHLLSMERPDVPLYVFTSDPVVYRRLALWWGVTPILGDFPTASDDMIRELEKELLARHEVVPGALLVMVGAIPFRP